MNIGKKLPFPFSLTKGIANSCVPSSYANLFQDKYFFRFFINHIKNGGNKDGMSYASEIKMMYEYSNHNNGFLNTNNHVIPMTVFEANGKFSVPERYLIEIFEDEPEKTTAYTYFLRVVTSSAQFHSIVIIRYNGEVYMIDSKAENVLILSVEDLIQDHTFLKRVTTLSFLHNTETETPIVYEASKLSHLL